MCENCDPNDPEGAGYDDYDPYYDDPQTETEEDRW